MVRCVRGLCRNVQDRPRQPFVHRTTCCDSLFVGIMALSGLYSPIPSTNKSVVNLRDFKAGCQTDILRVSTIMQDLLTTLLWLPPGTCSQQTVANPSQMSSPYNYNILTVYNSPPTILKQLQSASNHPTPYKCHGDYGKGDSNVYGQPMRWSAGLNILYLNYTFTKLKPEDLLACSRNLLTSFHVILSPAGLVVFILNSLILLGCACLCVCTLVCMVCVGACLLARCFFFLHVHGK